MDNICLRFVIQECRFKLIQHSAFPADLSPSDFFLFSKMKEKLSGCQLNRDDEVFLKVQYEDFYKEGIDMLFNIWTKCVNVVGDN